jgi:hypothetical protein
MYTTLAHGQSFEYHVNIIMIGEVWFSRNGDVSQV